MAEFSHTTTSSTPSDEQACSNMSTWLFSRVCQFYFVMQKLLWDLIVCVFCKRVNLNVYWKWSWEEWDCHRIRKGTTTWCFQFVTVVSCWLFKRETIWVFCNKEKKWLGFVLWFLGQIENEFFFFFFFCHWWPKEKKIKSKMHSKHALASLTILVSRLFLALYTFTSVYWAVIRYNPWPPLCLKMPQPVISNNEGIRP